MVKIAAAKQGISGSRKTFEELDAARLAIVASPETVLRKLEAAYQLLEFGHLVCVFQFGSMPSDQARANIDRLAEYVFPRVRSLTPASV